MMERIRSLLRDRRVVGGLAGVLVLVVAVALAVRGGEEEAPVTTTTSITTTTSTTTSTTTTTTVVEGLVWPLTGLPVQVDPALLERRILVVKVDNSRSARPQTGLAEADLVLEVAVEGGVTRFLAFFHSADPEEVGPVRSVREVDPKLLGPFDAMVAHSGGVPDVVASLRGVAADLGHPVLGSQAYRRVPGRPAPYDLILDVEAARAAAPPWEGEVPRVLEFARDAFPGDPATEVEVRISATPAVVYRYSQVEGGYLRFHGQEAHEDVDGRQMAVDTVVVVFVESVDTGRRDASGSAVPDYEVLGTGRAVVFHGGRVADGSWERGRLQDFFRFFDGDGQPLPLPPGRTWIEVVPTGGSVEHR